MTRDEARTALTRRISATDTALYDADIPTATVNELTATLYHETGVAARCYVLGTIDHETFVLTVLAAEERFAERVAA